MGRQIVRSNQNVAVDEVASVVSAIINTSTVPRRRRRVATHSDATSTSTEYDDHLKIDRILYNAFGDIMSIARNTEIDWMAQYNEEQIGGISLNNAQNDAIENFLMDFIQEQRESFVEAIRNLNLSQEMPEPPENNGNNVNNEQIVVSESPIVNNTAAVNADNSEASSIISLQRVVAQYPVAAARDSLEQDRSVDHISGENVSNAATIHSDPRMSLQPRASANPRVVSNSDSKTPMTSKSYSPPGNSYFGDNASQFSFGGLSFHSDIGNMRYSSSSNGPGHTQKHQNDRFSFDPTQNFQFDMDFNKSQQPKTQSRFFTQPLNPSQSQNDFMRSPNDDSFLDVQFSQQQEDFGDLGTSLTFQSFSSKSIPDSQQRRPNLSNIRKNTATSRSLTHLPAGNNSGNSFSTNAVSILIYWVDLL